MDIYHRNNWPAVLESSPLAVSVKAHGSVEICAGDSIKLEAIGSSGVTRYSWSPASGEGTGKTLWVRPARTTTYTVRAYSMEPCNDSVSAQLKVTVNPRPTLTISRTIYHCIGDTTRLVASVDGSPPFQYNWSQGDFIDSQDLPVVRVSPRTTTRYRIEVIDSAGCSTVDSINVVVIQPPVALAGRDTLLCRGKGLLLGGDDNPENRYSWDPGIWLSDSSRARPLATPDSTTTYILTVTSPVGCVSRDTIIVRVIDSASVDAGQDAIICSGTGHLIGTTQRSGYTYAWRPSTGLNDATIAQPIAGPSSTTMYYLTATNSVGCTAVDSVLVTVSTNRLNVGSDLLDFGMLDGCASSKDLDVQVTNGGDDPLRITGRTDAGFAIVAPALPFDLMSGESRYITVRFAPGGEGQHEGMMIVSGHPCDVQDTIVLTGRKERADVVVVPPLLEFGSRLSCDVIDTMLDVTITNSATFDATIIDAMTTAPYSIVSPVFPVTVASNGSLNVRVRFTPAANGEHRQDVRLPFQSGTCRDTLRVALSGRVEQPSLNVENDSMDFGLLGACQTVWDTILTLRNDGLFDITVTGTTAPAGYRLVTSTPLVVGAGQSVTLHLRYEPATSGASSGELVLKYGPCDGELRIALSGTKQGVSFTLPDTLDFGEVIDCREGSKTMKLSIGYSGEAGVDGSIRSVAITGPFTTTARNGDLLASGSATEFDATFTPTADGVTSGFIELALEPCGITRRIELRGSRTSAVLAAQVLDFGTQPVGTSPSGEALFINEGSTPLMVDGVNPLAAPFTITSTTPTLPATLQPGETLRVAVRYDAAGGENNDTVRASISQPCAMTASAAVRGIGASGATAVVALPTLTAAAGDRVRLPLVLQSSSGLDAINATRFTATISFDRSLLVPQNKRGVSSDATTRRITISGERGAGDTLAIVELTATLGVAGSTPLTIDSLRWSDPSDLSDLSDRITSTLRHGELQITGICESGGARLFDGSGEVALKAATPNPASGIAAIEYQLSESGPTDLYVLDVAGRRVATLFSGEGSSGWYIAWLDAGSLSSGSYVCVLKTPTLVLTERLEVRQ